MVPLHRRPSTGGFRCALPEGVGSLEWDYLRLNPLENPWCITQSRFKAVSTVGVSFGAADVMRASMGGPGGFLRHCSGGVGVCSSPAVLGGWVVDGENTL